MFACGARSELHGTGIAVEASTEDADFVPCSDASACNASESYCRNVNDDAGLTTACMPLPPSCHACACTPVPKGNFVCVCTSDGDQIVLSCNAM